MTFSHSVTRRCRAQQTTEATPETFLCHILMHLRADWRRCNSKYQKQNKRRVKSKQGDRRIKHRFQEVFVSSSCHAEIERIYAHYLQTPATASVPRPQFDTLRPEPFVTHKSTHAKPVPNPLLRCKFNDDNGSAVMMASTAMTQRWKRQRV